MGKTVWTECSAPNGHCFVLKWAEHLGLMKIPDLDDLQCQQTMIMLMEFVPWFMKMAIQCPRDCWGSEHHHRIMTHNFNRKQILTTTHQLMHHSLSANIWQNTRQPTVVARLGPSRIFKGNCERTLLSNDKWHWEKYDTTAVCHSKKTYSMFHFSNGRNIRRNVLPTERTT